MVFWIALTRWNRVEIGWPMGRGKAPLLHFDDAYFKRTNHQVARPGSLALAGLSTDLFDSRAVLHSPPSASFEAARRSAAAANAQPVLVLTPTARANQTATALLLKKAPCDH